MLETIAQRLESVLPRPSECAYASARFVEERSERITVRQNVVEPLAADLDVGVMITVMHGGGYGYAATSDLSDVGLAAAVERARAWSAKTASRQVDSHRSETALGRR
jgi:predicted Zn-dependent protease